jgi:cation diffusion facilitator family transporter
LDHPFGHARYEYISGLVVAALILVVGVELAEGSFRKIFAPSSVYISVPTLLVLVVSLLVKLWMSRFNMKLGQMIRSGTLKATSVDSRNDAIATSAVLLGCFFEFVFHIPVDGYCGLAVALFVIWSGIGVARETISPLLGQRADQGLVEKINALILSDGNVLGVHDLLVHDYGPGQCFASVHVEISADENPLHCHDIIDRIECSAMEELNVHLVIHYDPVEKNDREREEMLTLIKEILHNIDPCYSVHDFRIVRGSVKPKLVFDLALPYEKKQEHQTIVQAVEDALKYHKKDYLTVIHFDNIA